MIKNTTKFQFYTPKLITLMIKINNLQRQINKETKKLNQLVPIMKDRGPLLFYYMGRNMRMRQYWDIETILSDDPLGNHLAKQLIDCYA